MAGLHENFDREDENLGSSDRGFGQVFAGFFALVGALKWWFANALWPYWFAGALVFLVLAYAAPRVLAPLNRLWTKLALLLYKIVNPLTMGFLFFLVMTPMGLVMRAFGKDFLRRRRDPGAASYWIAREPPGPAPDSMKNQF
jgi:hypothetical protein